MSKLKIFLLVVLMGFSWTATNAQNKLNVEVSHQTIEVNQILTIRYTASNIDVDRFDQPDFSPFNIVSGPSRSNSISIINGQRSSESSWSYQIMAPTQAGEYEISPAVITSNGKKIRSNSVIVKVIEDGGLRSEGEIDKLDGDLEYFVRVESDVDTAFPGQMIVLTCKIYSRVDLASYEILKAPEIEESSTQRITQYSSGLERELVDGINYYTKIVDEIAIFPQKPGNIIVSPYVLRLARRKNENGDSWFLFSRNYDYDTRASNEVTLTINPLPLPIPGDFTGGVGEYDVDLYFDPPLSKTNTTLTGQLHIKGQGDIKRIQPPAIDWPESFELFDVTTVKEEYREGLAGLSGEKVFEYILVPKDKGHFDINCNFTFFSTTEQEYITIQANTSIDVQLGTDSSGKISSSIDEEQIDRPLIYDNPPNSKSKTLPRLIIGSLIVLVALLIGGLFWMKKHKNSKTEKLTFKKASIYELTSVFDQSNNIDEFYLTLNRILYRWVANQKGISPADVDKLTALSAIDNSRLDDEGKNTAKYLLNTCEMTLYAPITSETRMHDDYTKAVQWLERYA